MTLILLCFMLRAQFEFCKKRNKKEHYFTLRWTTTVACFFLFFSSFFTFAVLKLATLFHSRPTNASGYFLQPSSVIFCVLLVIAFPYKNSIYLNFCTKTWYC